MINFLGIGAPKSATTWLAACMADHPQIYMPAVKEVSFFSAEEKWTGEYSDYLKLFENAKDGQKSGEFSVTYLGKGEKAASRIYDFNKNLKLIAVLRDPVKRSFSHYKWLKQIGRLDKNIDFFSALKIHPRIISDSIYGKNLNIFLKYFPKENFLLIDYEDIKKDPELVVNNVFAFLGVDSDYKSKLTKAVVGKTINVRYRFLENLRLNLFSIVKRSQFSGLIFYFKKFGISNLYRKINSLKDEENLTMEKYKKIRKIFFEDLILLKQLFDEWDFNWKF